jgi:histone-lysine N-methyltransferase SETMAR
MFDKVIAGEETWCFQYNPETNRQTMQWKTQNSPQPKKARMSRSQVKTMFVCFFDHKRIVHYEFTAQGQTVNQQCYLEVLTRLRESVRRKRPGIWPDKWILHHDNISAHDEFRVREFMATNSIPNMEHPPYSPDLAPCDFWLFPKLKNSLKGQRLAYLSDIQRNVKTLQRGIPENDFQDCFRQWHNHLTKCIVSQGEYFEGDSSRQCTGKQMLAFIWTFREFNFALRNVVYIAPTCSGIVITPSLGSRYKNVFKTYSNKMSQYAFFSVT